MKSTMEITIWNRTGMGKCINKLIYWWNSMYHKREIKCKCFKKHSGWHSGRTCFLLNISSQFFEWCEFINLVIKMSYVSWLNFLKTFLEDILTAAQWYYFSSNSPLATFLIKKSCFLKLQWDVLTTILEHPTTDVCTQPI